LPPADCLAKYQLPPGATVLQGGRAIIESLKIGIAAAGGSGKVLVATADIPLLTPEAVNDFIGKCSAVDADLYYPVVSREVNRRTYPKTERTYVRLREGTFTGGNLILLNPEIVARCEEKAEYIFRYRKNPYILCQMLGWGFVLKFAFRQLGLREVEQRMSEILGIRGVVIQSSYPEVGIDVDKPSDLELVRAAFAGRA